MHYKDYFKGKKITLMGLGLLGRGVGDAEFLAECGAELIVTDLKSEKDLATSLKRLKKFLNIKYTLGEHRLEDFVGRDFILKAAGVPLNSPFIAEAKKNGIPIEMDASLFMKLAPEGVKIIGITGTRGKSTVTHLIYSILKEVNKVVYLGGNVKDTATLPLLEKIKAGDFVVLELDSWQLQGFGDSKISPHISVFTNFMYDHMNYYGGSMDLYWEDKANIFTYQKAEDTLVLGASLAENQKVKTKAKVIKADKSIVPASWQRNLLGEHNTENIACAISVARALDIGEEIIQKAVLEFKPVSGRLEFLKEIRGVKIYNDTNATTADATLAGLKALAGASRFALHAPRIILIMGGADKGLDMSRLVEALPEYCKEVILLLGTGTEKFIVTQNMKRKTSEGEDSLSLHAIRYTLQNIPVYKMEKLEDCLRHAMVVATSGDVVLFSPAFASFGMFKNEYDRGEQFVELVNSL